MDEETIKIIASYQKEMYTHFSRYVRSKIIIAVDHTVKLV